MSTLIVSGSPHVHGDTSVKKIMYGVVIAMVPAILVSVYFFGLDALRVFAVSSLACLFFEWVIQKYLIKGPITINDGSALVTGVLLAFNVPSNLPTWILIIGAFAAIAIAKMSFGGLGKNPFNLAHTTSLVRRGSSDGCCHWSYTIGAVERWFEDGQDRA